MFRMKVLNQLNGRQREEVRDLENLCREHDKIQGGISLTAEEDSGEIPVFFLSYEEDKLAGFAAMYVMEDKTAETCGYIHPEYRKRTIYKKMLTAIRKEKERAGIRQNYVVHEPGNSDSFELLLQAGDFEYAYSEYLMEWKYSYQLLPTNTLTVLPVTEALERPVAELLSGVFPMERSEAEDRIRQLSSENCRFYSVWRQKELVGTFCLSFGRESVYVFDFAVDGDHQGRGIGKAMLKELIRLVQTESAEQETVSKKIRLQVGSRNETAFRLYQKNGFQVISQRDYYQVIWP